MAINSYKDLIVWQKSIGLTVQVYQVTKDFPDSEKFGLTSQLKRAVNSVSINIAESYGRNSSKHYTNFLNYSRGSLYEGECALILSKKLELSKSNFHDDLILKIEEISKMLTSLINKLTISLENSNYASEDELEYLINHQNLETNPQTPLPNS